jgi:hypothetical protein
MKQEFSTVWKDGSEWFDFPATNEQSVMDMLVKKNEMQHCIILPKGESPNSMKKVIITQIKEEPTQTKTTQTKKK